MRLSQCIAATDGALLCREGVQGDCEFNHLSTDTRKIQAGELFVALRGENFDGHAFANQAAEAGACGLVLEQENDRLALPQLIVENTTAALGGIATVKREYFDGTLVAITGSSGKTTVKGMLAAILANCGAVKATPGNYNNQIGVPLTLMTLEPGDQYAVIEMGANGLGEISYLAGLAKPDVALVNNIMPAHLEGFGSLLGVAEEKTQIYGALGPKGHAVINLDDNFAHYFIKATLTTQRWGFCVGEPAHIPDDISIVCATQITQNDFGCAAFELFSDVGAASIQLAVVGRHNVANALAAATCAIAAGVNLEAIREGLAAFTGEAGRMQVGKAWNGARLIDDTYNANPGSVRAAIDCLSTFAQTKILVLGDLAELGGESAQSHAELGTYAHQKGIDQLFTCGELARQAAIAFGDKSQHFTTQKELVHSLKSTLQPAAVVLVKGSRSVRMENIVAALSQTGEQQ